MSPRQWLLSPQGKKVVKEALKAIDKSERELREKMRLKPEDLHKRWGVG